MNKYLLTIYVWILTLYVAAAQKPESGLNTFKFYISTKDSLTHKNLGGANFIMQFANTTISGITDSTGNYLTTHAYAADFTFYGGKWGYYTKEFNYTIDSATGVIFIKLVQGYYDGFLFANAWQTSFLKGMKWQRVEADTTKHAAFYPSYSDTTDYGDYYMQTGTTVQRMDSGRLYMSSPVLNLKGYIKPLLNFTAFLTSAHLPSTDSLNIYMVKGSDTTLLESIASEDSIAQWHRYWIYLPSWAHDTGHILFRAISNGGEFKAGIDKFYIVDASSSVADISTSHINNCDKTVTIKSNFELPFSFNVKRPVNIELYNMEGKRLYTATYNEGNWSFPPLVNGVYLMKVRSDDLQCVKTFNIAH